MKNAGLRSFGVTLVLLSAALAFPFFSCSVNHQPGMQRTIGPPCRPDDDPNGPIVCIDGRGFPSTETVNANRADGNGGANPIIFRSPRGSKLALSLKDCKNIQLSSCGHTNVCIAMTIPTATNAPICKYQAFVDGVAGPDPYVATDNCCPPVLDSKKEKP